MFCKVNTIHLLILLSVGLIGTGFFSISSLADPILFHLIDFRQDDPGSLNVDESFHTSLFTGSFRYNYNIEVPPGTNGLQPDLNIFYVSQKFKDKPSLLGSSWDMTQNYIQRDVNHTVTDTSDDFFNLMFQGSSYELVYTDSGYHTEIETFLDIENASGAPNENDEYWIIKTKDGTSYRFGFTNNSERVANQADHTWRWHLDLVNDTHNNSIFYNYFENETNGITFLTVIKYNNDGDRIITFIYEHLDTQNTVEYYQHGHRINQSSRLKEINIYAKNSTFNPQEIKGWIVHTFEDGNASSCRNNGLICWDDINNHLWPNSIGSYGTQGDFNRSGTDPRPLDTNSNNYWQATDDDILDDEVWLYLNSSEVKRISAISVALFNDSSIHNFNVSVSNSSDGPWTEVVTNATRHNITVFDIDDVDAKYILIFFSNLTIYHPTLEEVEAWEINSTFLRRYKFEYIEIGNNSRSFLKNITQIGYDASTNLPSTEFNYYPVNTGWTSNTSWYPPDVCFSSGGPLYHNNGVRLADVNGDGLIDIMRNMQGNTCTESGTGTWINNGAGWTLDPAWYPPTCLSNNTGGEIGARVTDVNGDGLVDIIQHNGTRIGAWINNGSGWVNDTNMTWYPPIILIDSSQDVGIRVVDLNGDGRADIIRHYEPFNVNEVWINNGSGWTNDTNMTWYSPIEFADSYKDVGTRFADVNGDGLVDIIRNKNDVTKGAYINIGRGFSSNKAYWHSPLAFLDSSGDTGTRFADVNGDGLVDLIKNVESSGLCIAGRDSRINYGQGWIHDPQWYPPICFSSGSPLYQDYGVKLADVNGDGYIDIIRNQGSDGSCTAARGAWINNGEKSYLLAGIETSSGGHITIDYRQSTYLNNTGNDSIVDLSFNLWLVSSITRNSEMNESPNITTTYDYANGSYNHIKDEFRGFGYAEETQTDGTKTKHFFHQDDGLVGREYKAEVMNSNDSTYVIQEFNWSTNLTDGFYITQLEDQRSFTYDGSSTPKITNTSYTYDSYGNIITKTSHGDFDLTDDERYEYFEFAYNTSAWIVNKPNKYQLFASDNSTKLRETKYSYDNLAHGTSPRTGDLTEQENNLVSGGNPITTFEYDSFGNLIKQTDPNGRETEIKFGTHDTTNTFPDKQINALGHVTEFVYDLGTGNILSTTDPNGFVTNYTYDVFGRIKKEVQEYDSVNYPTVEYNYNFDGIAPERVNISRRETISTNNTYDTYIFYDGFGKTVQTKSEAEYNKQIVTDFYYDENGRITSQSLPYFADFNSEFTTPNTSINLSNTSYDTLNRITEILNPDGTARKFNYHLWNITTTDENDNNKTSVLNAYGNIIEIYEFNNNEVYLTTYIYNDGSQLTNITDNEGNEFSFTYDTLGRKTSMTDPDMGTWNYSYDSNGNIISQNDGRGTTVSMEYDELNRITEKNSSSDQYIFTYDVEFNGTLYQINESNNLEINYGYDNRIRTINESISIKNKSFRSNYTYDSLDRITNIILPNSESINITYNNQNEINSIESIIFDVDYNELNNILWRVYNNTLQTNFTYNSQNLRLEGISTNNLQNLEYTFNNISSVTTIQDVVNSINYSMDYDDLDRLIYARRDSNLNNINYTINYSYSSIGNIENVTLNNDVLIYHYNYSSPHAPSNITTLNQPKLVASNLQIIYENDTIKVFSFIITNNDDEEMNNISWILDTGENAIVSEYNTTLQIGESIFIYVTHNYTTLSDYIIRANTTNGIYFHSTELKPASYISVGNLSFIYENESVKVYTFHIANTGISTMNNISWSFYTGESVINSQYNTTLDPGNSIFVYVAHNYTTPDNYNVTANATNGIFYDNDTWPAVENQSGSTETFIYDSNGNVIQDDLYYYEYNNFNRLEKVRLDNASGNIVEEYYYNHDGNRLYKNEPQKNQITYYISQNFIQVINDSGTYDTVYYFNKDGIIARKDPSDDKFYYHPDHLGSTTLITNSSGDAVQETNYYPYGTVLYDANSRFLYTGKELDSTNLMYYGARYYRPDARIWYEPDPLIADLYQPQGLNRYSYVLNNPYKYVDPDGNAIALTFGISPVGVFSQSTGSLLLGQTKITYFSRLFRNSQLFKEFREAGYKPLEKIPPESSIHKLTDQWKYGGMAKEGKGGEWSAIRWDVPKGPYPHGEVWGPHANQHLFKPGGRLGLEEFGKPILKHFQLYSSLFPTIIPGFGYSDTIDQTIQNGGYAGSLGTINGGGGTCGVDTSCGLFSPVGGENLDTNVDSNTDNSGPCGIFIWCA